MQYDHLGFPIPPQFVTPGDDGETPRERGPRRREGAGPGKTLFVLALLAAVVVPGLLAPGIMPAVREAVVQWSLEQAAAREGRGRVAAAIGDLGRAISWSADDDDRRGRLLCWRAMLRINDGDAPGAVVDATAAAALAPTASQPRRVRALAQVMLGQTDAALADSQAAVDLAGPNDPEALNHRAYIRALVDRDLAAALADIDTALAGTDAGSPDFLDTRGFILHKLGRHQEAVDDLNVAIDGLQRTRRQLVTIGRQGDPDEVALRMRSLDHGLAVMHHHRGLACRALGLAKQAEQDFTLAEKKGFDPSRGVF
jgi:tetratricopeptide (TPR) repeat protein